MKKYDLLLLILCIIILVLLYRNTYDQSNQSLEDERYAYKKVGSVPNSKPVPSKPYLFINRLNNSTFCYDYVIQRRDTSIDIAIIVVVEGAVTRNAYRLAQNTLGCYARLQSYPLYYLDIGKDPTYGGQCPHKDFMFKRHCVVPHFMAKSNHTWFLFLDGDIGVINPNHFIESYLPSSDYSMLFYKRLFNYEIMAGSYLARNDQFSRKFLLDWANYEYRVPKSWHGTDNGAIHSAVADLIVPGDVAHRNVCYYIWSRSKNDWGLSTYTVCLQMYLANYSIPRIKILEKGRESYSRDGWQTDSSWSQKDFMFHGWQIKRLDKEVFAGWHSPLAEEKFDLEKCFDPWAAGPQWRYKDAFFKTDEELDRVISQNIEFTAKNYTIQAEDVKKLYQEERNLEEFDINNKEENP